MEKAANVLDIVGNIFSNSIEKAVHNYYRDIMKKDPNVIGYVFSGGCLKLYLKIPVSKSCQDNYKFKGSFNEIVSEYEFISK